MGNSIVKFMNNRQNHNGLLWGRVVVDGAPYRGSAYPMAPEEEMENRLVQVFDPKLRIFDLQGARVRTVLDEVVTAGRHTASWDGRDDRGRPVASGVYMVRIVGAEVSGSGKVVLLRN